jgi:hypothetical protein
LKHFQLEELAFKHGDIYEKRKKETRLDIHTGSRDEDDGAKENASCKNRTDPEADRGRNATKGIQYWSFFGFPGIGFRVE